MNTTDVAVLAVTGLTGGGIAAAGLALRKAVQAAVWQGYGFTVSLCSVNITPPKQAVQKAAAAQSAKPASSKYANDSYTRQERQPGGRFGSLAPDELRQVS